jgi:pimeloyl-ACP methyl ester carboxylesterase
MATSLLSDRRPTGAGSHLSVRYSAPAGSPGSAVSDACILYLHGFGSHQAGEKAEFFRQQALAAGLAFCSFDFEGHGASGGTMRELTLTRNLDNVREVAAWLESRGHPRVCLLGSSMGGGTAMWFSALHPEKVIAGLHLAPALALETALLTWAGPERASRWQESGVLHFQDDLVSCDLGWDLIEDLRTYDVQDLLTRYRTPTLLLQGRLDTTVPWRGVVDFASRCPYRDIDVHLFADGDHRLTDRKARLWDLMMEFLKGRRLHPTP